jgi:signal transduction histidine kinase
VRLPEIVHRTGFRWGMAVAGLFAASSVLLFAAIFLLADAGMLRTVDRSVLEQLVLLSERPPNLLPFMIASRMAHQPRVITSVGLFAPDRRLIVGDIATIPRLVRLDNTVQTLAIPNADGAPQRIAGLRLHDGRILVVARSLHDVLEVRANLLRAFALGLIPTVLISMLAGTLVGLRTQRRLVRLHRSAERIIAGDLAERLPVRPAGDELDQTAMIVNRILDQLQELVTALQGAGENVAHDLRTPLTWVRARLERARDGSCRQGGVRPLLDQSIGGIDQALAIIAALLRIAEIEHVRRHAGFAEFDLAEVVREMAEAYRPVAEEKGVVLEADVPHAVRIRGDRDLILEAVMNLVDNAVKFTPRGGFVAVAVCGGIARPVVRIADTGPGIPPQERHMVLRRFYRSDRSRGSAGTGLGLSLVAAVAKLHCFSLCLDDNEPGCVVTLHCWEQAGALRVGRENSDSSISGKSA